MNSDTESKEIIINFMKTFKEIREDTKAQHNGIKQKELKENQCLNDITRLMEITMMIQDFKTEFTKEIEIFYWTQAEMKMEF